MIKNKKKASVKNNDKNIHRNGVNQKVCHYCFGKGYVPEEGYAGCPYCDGTGFENIQEYDCDDYDDECENN